MKGFNVFVPVQLCHRFRSIEDTALSFLNLLDSKSFENVNYFPFSCTPTADSCKESNLLLDGGKKAGNNLVSFPGLILDVHPP